MHVLGPGFHDIRHNVGFEPFTMRYPNALGYMSARRGSDGRLHEHMLPALPTSLLRLPAPLSLVFFSL